MRTIVRLIVSLILIAVGFALGWIHGQGPAGSSKSIANIDSGPTIERIQALSSLTTLKINVADALVTELAGKTGSIKAVLVVHGSVTLGVDLSRAKFETEDIASRTAVLELPAPQVESAGLDQQKTKIVVLCESGLWMIVPGGQEADAAATDLALREGEAVVASAGSDPDLIRRSRRRAEQVITTFLETLGWHVDIRWS